MIKIEKSALNNEDILNQPSRQRFNWNMIIIWGISLAIAHNKSMVYERTRRHSSAFKQPQQTINRINCIQARIIPIDVKNEYLKILINR